MAQANFSVALIFWFFLIKQKEQLESSHHQRSNIFFLKYINIITIYYRHFAPTGLSLSW
jgi:hypothetical protein